MTIIDSTRRQAKIDRAAKDGGAPVARWDCLYSLEEVEALLAEIARLAEIEDVRFTRILEMETQLDANALRIAELERQIADFRKTIQRQATAIFEHIRWLNRYGHVLDEDDDPDDPFTKMGRHIGAEIEEGNDLPSTLVDEVEVEPSITLTLPKDFTGSITFFRTDQS